MAESKQIILPSVIDLPLDQEVLEEIVIKAKDYALMHGICMRSKAGFNPDTLQVRNLSIFTIWLLSN
jgi:glutathione synthase